MNFSWFSVCGYCMHFLKYENMFFHVILLFMCIFYNVIHKEMNKYILILFNQNILPIRM